MIVEAPKCLIPYKQISAFVRSERTVMRVHNLEHSYYEALSWAERRPAKKLFLQFEAHRYRRLERKRAAFAPFDAFWFISDTEIGATEFYPADGQRKMGAAHRQRPPPPAGLRAQPAAPT